MKELVEQIKTHEGFRKFPYKDTVGKLTIGHGWNLEDRGIDEFEAELILRFQLLEIESQLKMFSWFNKQNRVRKDALIDMAFNLGLNGLLKFHNMIRALEREDFTRAKAEALDSKWARQVGVRADTISSMLESGER